MSRLFGQLAASRHRMLGLPCAMAGRATAPANEPPAAACWRNLRRFMGVSTRGVTDLTCFASCFSCERLRVVDSRENTTRAAAQLSYTFYHYRIRKIVNHLLATGAAQGGNERPLSQGCGAATHTDQ